jgi:iron complex outermembrane receptor protein
VNEKASPRRSRRPALLLLLLGTTAAPSFAQDAAPVPPEDEEAIIVTGTRAQDRTRLDTPVPIDVFSARDLASTGAVANELGQAIATLAPSVNFPRQSNSGTSDHIRAAQLRGLSPDQVLVLVNGRRRHVSAVVNTETKIGRGTAAVDLNTIPLGAVRRVEILRDGAGAQYGSDAIAGVINIILDDRPSGIDASVNYGAHVTHNDAVDDDVVDGETLTLNASAGVPLGGAGGFARFGLEYVNRNATNRAGFDQLPFFIPQTAPNLALRGVRNYSEGDPTTESITGWFNSGLPLGAVELYAFGTLSERKTEGSFFFRYPDSSSNVPELFPQGVLPRTTGDDLNYSIAAGLRSEFLGWKADAGVTHGRNRFIYGAENSLNASLGPASPTRFRSGTFIFSQSVANLDLGRPLDLGLGSPLTLALGAEYRRERFASRAGEPASFLAGPFELDAGAQGAPGLTPQDEAHERRHVYGIYADLSGDLGPRLFVDLAARLESYSDAGEEVTAKASAIYKLTPSVALRGSVSNNARAPALGQIGFSDRTINFGTNRTRVLTRTLPVADPIAVALGAEPLRPETSFNITAGVTARIAPGLDLTIDAFRIDVDDRITLSDRLFGPAIANFVQMQPGGAGTESVRFFTNAVDTRTRGVDAVLTYNRQFGGGSLNLSAAFSYAETDIRSFAQTPSALTSVDPSLRLVGPEEINTIEEAAPRSKLVVSGRWKREALEVSGRVSRFGSAVRVFNFGGGFEPRQRYGAELSVDGQVELAVTSQVRAQIGVVNLFDNYPDRSDDAINFFGNLPYDILSPIGINGRYLHAGLRFEL